MGGGGEYHEQLLSSACFSASLNSPALYAGGIGESSPSDAAQGVAPDPVPPSPRIHSSTEKGLRELPPPPQPPRAQGPGCLEAVSQTSGTMNLRSTLLYQISKQEAKFIRTCGTCSLYGTFPEENSNDCPFWIKMRKGKGGTKGPMRKQQIFGVED